MNSIDLKGKKAIVTGASGSIGSAIAERFRRSGAILSLWDLKKPDAGAGEYGFAVNVTDSAQVADAAKATSDALGGIDILINCAGIAGSVGPIEDYSDKDFDDVVKINLYGAFYCGRAVLPYMRQGGYGRIVNFASMAGKDGNPNACAYSAAKAGVIGLTKSMGKELARTGILVNAVAPGVIDSEMVRHEPEEHIQSLLAKMPMARLGSVDEVAALVSWIASEDCSFTTGFIFDISGGRAVY